MRVLTEDDLHLSVPLGILSESHITQSHTASGDVGVCTSMTDKRLAILIQKGTIFKVPLDLQLLMGLANTVVGPASPFFHACFLQVLIPETSGKHPAF